MPKFHRKLREIAECSGASVRSLIVQALEQRCGTAGKREYVTGPLVKGCGRLGPAFPEDENPHDVPRRFQR